MKASPITDSFLPTLHRASISAQRCAINIVVTEMLRGSIKEVNGDVNQGTLVHTRQLQFTFEWEFVSVQNN